MRLCGFFWKKWAKSEKGKYRIQTLDSERTSEYIKRIILIKVIFFFLCNTAEGGI